MSRNWVLTAGLAFDPVTDDEAELKQALADLRAFAGKGATRGGEKGGYYATLSAELTPVKYPEVESELLDYASRHRMADEARDIVYAELDKLIEVNPSAIEQIRKSVRKRVREITGVPDWDISESVVRSRIDQLGLTSVGSTPPSENPVDAYNRYANASFEGMKSYDLKLRPLLTTVDASDLYDFLEQRGATAVRSESDETILGFFRAAQTNSPNESEERKAAVKDLMVIGAEIFERGLRRDYDAYLAKHGIDAILAELDMLPVGSTVPESAAYRQANELADYTANAEEAALLLLGCIMNKGLVCPMSYEELLGAARGVIRKPKPVTEQATAAVGVGVADSSAAAGEYVSADEIVRRAQEKVRAEVNASRATHTAQGVSNVEVGNDRKATAQSSVQVGKKTSAFRRVAGIVLAALIVSGILSSILGMCSGNQSKQSGPKAEQPVVASAAYNESYSGPLFPAADADSDFAGYLGTDGKWAIKPAFKAVSFFADGRALQQDSLSGLYGYINEKGDWAIEPQFMYGEDFSEGYAIVKDSNDGPFYYIDVAGEKAFVNLQNDMRPVTGFSDGHAWMVVNDDSAASYTMKVVDKSGKVSGELKVSKDGYLPGAFHEGLSAWVDSDGYMCFVDTAGKVQIRGKYRAASAFGNGYAAVQSNDNGKWGYIDKNGNTVAPAQFEEATNFQEGYAVVNSGGYYYCIDTNFKLVDHAFTECDLFVGGLTCANDGRSFGLFDTSGKLVVDLSGVAKSCWTGKPEYYMPDSNKIR